MRYYLQILLLLISAPLHSSTPAQVYHASTPAQEYRELISDRPQVVTSLRQFVDAITGIVGNKPFTVYEYLGFSGASYRNLENYKSHVKLRALAAQRETRKQFGAGAIPVFLLGGTTDGFGAAYDVLQELRDGGKLQNVVVAGLVSDAAVKYHLQGLQEGWGEVISPKQDVLLLMDVYKSPGHDEAWELLKKPDGTSATVQVLLDLAAKPSARQVTMELFEGGAQAVKEAIEYLFVGQSSPLTRLVLHVGYEPKKIEKSRGFRAASNVGRLLKNKGKRRVPTFFTTMGDPAPLTPETYFRLPAGKAALGRQSAREQGGHAVKTYQHFAKKYSTTKLTYLSRRVQ